VTENVLCVAHTRAVLRQQPARPRWPPILSPSQHLGDVDAGSACDGEDGSRIAAVSGSRGITIPFPSARAKRDNLSQLV